MLAGFLEDDGEFQFVIEFLREVRREDDRLVGSDDGIDVLEEDDPRQHGMREAGLFGLMMMLAKVAGGVEELLGNDRRFDTNFVAREEDGSPSAPLSAFCA